MRTHLDLFSGIGGFAIAANFCGVQTVGFCEQDKFCQKILGANWPHVPIDDDIKTFNAEQFRGVWLATAGFPCQPFSNSGERRGKDDDRYLWEETLAAIAAARPAWVLLENVAGVVQMALDEILADLDAEGYASGAVLVPACGVNAPHLRSRIWVIALADAQGKQMGGRGSREMESEAGQKATTGDGLGDGREILADANGEYAQGRRADSHPQGRQKQKERPARLLRGGKERDSKSRVGFLADGIPAEFFDGSGWNAEPEGVPRVAKGIKNRTAKLKALGNGIVWPIAAEIIGTMIESEK